MSDTKNSNQDYQISKIEGSDCVYAESELTKQRNTSDPVDNRKIKENFKRLRKGRGARLRSLIDLS